MFRLISSMFIGIAIALGSFTAMTASAPTMLNAPTVRYRIQIPANVSRIQILNVTRLLNANEFDVAGMDLTKGTIDVITTTKGTVLLESKGLKGVIVSQSADLAPDNRYLTPATLEARMTALQQVNPKIARLVELGKSNQGRPIMGMLLSTTLDFNSSEYFLKPTIIFDGLHHAREIMTPEIVVDVGDTILKNTQSRGVQEILKNWNVWIIPMMNPDGSNIVFTSNNMWRKNARADANSIYGVDINRNYNYRFGECNGSSSSKGSDTYHGAGPTSEPETQAITKLADYVHPTASLSYHSYSELVLYPFGCQGDVTSENTMIQKIAGELAAQLPSDSGGKHYAPGTPWQLLYSVDGSSMDYMYAAHGALAYTFEVNTDFQPSYDIRNATVAKHRNAWMYFINRATLNMLTVNVTDAKTGKLAEALIAVNTVSHVKKELPLRTNRIGKFFKVLDPGQYIVSAKLPDGRTGQVTVQMTGQPVTTTLTIP